MCSSTIPSPFYEVKRKIRDLGLGYETIHAWSADMKWHRDKRVEIDDVLRHLVDAEGWKHFDCEFPDFAFNPRKVCLGLASNGFNPLDHMSGLRFHTSKRDSRCTTQNNGMMIISESNASESGDNNFYCVLDGVARSISDWKKCLAIQVSVSGFDETDAIFFKFIEDLNNFVEGSSSVDDNLGESNVSTPGVGALCSRQWEDSMSITSDANVGREYIEVVKDDLQCFFVLDFNDQEMNRFVEHQMLSTFKEFKDDCHKHFKKYSNLEKAHANLPHILNQMLELQSQPTPDGSQPLSSNQICETMLGRRPGYLKGLG
ncbi:CACTA en-spm transposon protein [Cucumis melo var. makuwa]|uniref:CACTA en-spm transposon protein n=1 Tax=Cucumis melo var. makuwa TaxID=1194695 RepID=A0A5D3D7J9_CUCMM|nr:CACTA en-spm transposon protein [Cucumis melo var. makuwa]TYK19538.1 CACTA en-spm transposon protein [Cucumis melo var. makuwa]